MLTTDHNVIWEAFPGTSQELALDSRADHTLYHGTRGPGKTAVQLMYYRQYVGVGYGAFWRGIIIDREYKNLSDVKSQSEKFFLQFGDGCKFLNSPSEFKWVWPTGEELLLRHMKKLSDYEDFHGHEYPFIGWNELTKHATCDLYDSMMSTNRSSFDPIKNTPRIKTFDGYYYNTPDKNPLPNIPLKVFSTTNSLGVGHNWVKRRFINVSPNGKLVRNTIRLFNPRTQKDEDITKTQVAIFGSYRENKLLAPEYVFELENEKNPIRRAAWLNGDWNISSGDAIGDLWNPYVHIIEPFPIPKGIAIDRAFDWGSSSPFAVTWWAEANGEILNPATGFCPPKGSLIQIDEIYGSDSIGTNKGVRISAQKIAEAITAKENQMLINGSIKDKVRPGPADRSIYDVRENDVDTIGKKMADFGIRWTEADKSKGSRINGLELFRGMLDCSLKGEGKCIYFMRNCTATLETVPFLPLDEDNLEDVDTEAEDHIYDTIRYRVLKGNNRLATDLKITYPR